MPYISKESRKDIWETQRPPDSPGELNYLLTNICLQYVDYNTPGYTIYNDVIGALEACKLEFYRRAVAPYEDKKIEENGDVY